MHFFGRKSPLLRITAEQCRFIDASRSMRQGILAWGLMGLSAWTKDAVTGEPPLELHYELYTPARCPCRVHHVPTQEKR
jgi:hypothetical protein